MSNCLVLLLVLFLCSSYSIASVKEVVPKLGVYLTRESILNARRLMETKTWAKTVGNNILLNADPWLKVSDAEIREMIPKEGAIFAYGTAGCPEHNLSWKAFGENGIVDLKRPGILRCPGGHDIDFLNPESKYYDEGSGVLIGGVRYFFQGVYNAAIVNTFTGWGSDEGIIHQLAYAYALTGDDRYAQKAAVILDCLAHLSPTTIGPRDFNPEEPEKVTGRMHLLSSIVHRTKVHMVRTYDLLYNHPAMHEKSFYSTKTVAENVADGLLLDYMFKEFDLRGGNFSTFHNHEADELRGMLATGLVLGIKDYIKWGLDGAGYFFENTIDKDGLYYEGSPSYGVFVQNVFGDIAELAYNYNPEKYALEGLPERVNYYDHPKLRELLFSYRDKLDVAGHFASFGNATSDRSRIEEYARNPAGEFSLIDRLYQRTEDPDLKLKYQEALDEMSQGDPDSLRQGIWALFNTAPESNEPQSRYRDVAQGNTAYFGTKSLAILGSGEGVHRRGLLLRGGPSLPHSHDDALALYYYDKGYLLTQDNGYYIFGSPLHRGWGTRAIGHNLVVIDNDIYRKENSWYKNSPGADLKGFADLPGLKYVHLNNPWQFPKDAEIKEYSRRSVLIDIDSFDSYVFDVFTVEGGKRHDYAFHTGAQFLETETEFKEIPDVWTLAGLDEPEASYDEKGKSWGERIIPGDLVKDLGIKEEGVRATGFNPPPGNGYGFIYDLKEGILKEQAFEGRFKFFDGRDTTLTNRLFVDQKTMFYKGLGPNLDGSERYPYIILRSESAENHKSRVISVMDAAAGFSSITDVKRENSNSFGIEFFDGQTHYILLNGGSIETPKGVFKSDADFAIAKFDGDKLQEVVVIGPGSALLGDLLLEAEKAVKEILDVDLDKSRITVSGDFPVKAGDQLVIDGDHYSRNTSYTVQDVTKKGDVTEITLDGSFILAKGFITTGRKRNFAVNAPLPIGFSYQDSTGLLEGKSFVSTKSGESQRIRSIGGFKRVYVNEDMDVKEGDDWVIVDVTKGDFAETLPVKIHRP